MDAESCCTVATSEAMRVDTRRLAMIEVTSKLIAALVLAFSTQSWEADGSILFFEASRTIAATSLLSATPGPIVGHDVRCQRGFHRRVCRIGEKRARRRSGAR